MYGSLNSPWVSQVNKLLLSLCFPFPWLSSFPFLNLLLSVSLLSPHSSPSSELCFENRIHTSHSTWQCVVINKHFEFNQSRKLYWDQFLKKKKKVPDIFPVKKEVVFNNPSYHKTSKTLESSVAISKYNSEAVFQFTSPIHDLFHPWFNGQIALGLFTHCSESFDPGLTTITVQPGERHWWSKKYFWQKMIKFWTSYWELLFLRNSCGRHK